MSTKALDKGRRVLALDVRPHRLGYAVFETPLRLIDFGVTRFDSADAGMSRVTALIGRFGPNAVVLRKITRRSTRNRPLTRAVLRLISRQVRHSSIPVAAFSNRQVRASLGKTQARTKHQVASLLSHAFPELAWRMPPPRKPWQPEPWNMPIFDAVAIGVSYFATQNDKSVIQKLTDW